MVDRLSDLSGLGACEVTNGWISVVEVKRDIRVLGAQRLECFDSTAWNQSIKNILLQSFYNLLSLGGGFQTRRFRSPPLLGKKLLTYHNSPRMVLNMCFKKTIFEESIMAGETVPLPVKSKSLRFCVFPNP